MIQLENTCIMQCPFGEKEMPRHSLQETRGMTKPTQKQNK